jgi:protein ImuB
VRAASPALEASARAALLDLALAFAPRAELAPRGAGPLAAEASVWLDASGIRARYPSEAGFAAALAECAAAAGLTGDVGIASSRRSAQLAALLASRERSAGDGNPRVFVVPAGREAALFSPLPIDWLGASDALQERLTRFGIRRLGELLALPRASLLTRLGREAAELVREATGEGEEPPLPLPEDARLCEALDLDFAIDCIPPLAFALQGLLARLCHRLALRQLAVGELELELSLDGGARDLRRIGLSAPSGDPKLLLRLVRSALEAQPTSAPVLSLRLTALGAEPARDQLDLFRPAGPAPAALAAVLNELRALCGAERVGAPALPNDFHPDALAQDSFRPERARRADPARPNRPGCLRDGIRDPDELRSAAPRCARVDRLPELAPALRQLRPAIPAQVRLRAEIPHQVTSAVARGRVVQLAGPWRTTGGWWSHEGRFAYDSFDVQLSDGTLLRLRLDRVRNRWEIDAIYD